MSGHSKWSKIKHQKGVKDAKRGMLFTKLARDITIAASQGGGDPDMNFVLRLAIEKAKQANMPKDNIKRAIQKGTGEDKSEVLESITYEAYGPNGVAVLIDCVTDNKNRTVSEVKKIVETHGGKMANIGSVSWKFEEKGLIIINPQKLKKSEKFGKEDEYIDMPVDEVLLEIMEIDGVEDINQSDDKTIEIFCGKIDLKKVEQAVRNLGFKIESFELIKFAKEQIKVPQEVVLKIEKLVSDLENHDDVNAVWTDIKL